MTSIWLPHISSPQEEPTVLNHEETTRPPMSCVPVADPFAFDELRFRHGLSRGRPWNLDDEPSVDVRDRPSTAGERSDLRRRPEDTASGSGADVTTRVASS